MTAGVSAHSCIGLRIYRAGRSADNTERSALHHGAPSTGCPMQLRVARLCLDCEELHAENRCPRCASERYAFLSTWLPSDERRRWRKPSSPSSDQPEAGLGAAVRSLARWFRGEPSHGESTPARRRSDLVTNLTFEEPATPPPQDSTVKATDRTSHTTASR